MFIKFINHFFIIIMYKQKTKDIKRKKEINIFTLK